MSMGDGDRSPYDWIDALLEAEVEMFLKKGILESNLEGCCVVEGGIDVDDDVEVTLLWLAKESINVSEPVCDKIGVSDFGMSPKYCWTSFTASSCCTPANATTILSGL